MANAYNNNKDKVMKVQSKYSNNIDKNFSGNVSINLKKIDLSKIEYIEVDDLYSAPSSWNFYSKLNDDSMYEMVDSILDNGLMSPIIVWKVDRKNIADLKEEDKYGFFGDEYMILSGHNRARAFIQLSQNENIGRGFLKIPAFVFQSLTEFQAKNIIVDSNYTQRTLDLKEKVESILYKYDVYTKEKTRKGGSTADFIANDLDVTPRMVYNYKKIADIIDPIKERLYGGDLALTSVLKLATKTKDFQTWLYDKYGDSIDNKLLNRIKDTTKKSDIDRWMTKLNEVEDEVVVKTKIPSHLENDFRKMVSDWIYNKTKRDEIRENSQVIS